MKKIFVLLACISLFFFLGTPVRADIAIPDGSVYLDPSDLQVNNNTPFLFGNEVHWLTDPFTISLVGHPNVTITDVFVVLATPGDTNTSPATIAGASPIGGTYEGDLTAGMDVYKDVLGLGAFHPDSSESFTNFTKYFDQNATNFDIWLYDLQRSLQGNSSISVDILSGPPMGTYAMAVGFGSDGMLYVTPFTQTGLVPEPGTLMLFGSGLLGLAFFGRRIISNKA